MVESTPNYNGILTSTKIAVGVDWSNAAFDVPILMYINSAFLSLYQLGVGPKHTFRVTGQTEQWSDFCGDDLDLETVKEYVTMKVKLKFDNITSGILKAQIDETIKEDEIRLRDQMEIFRKLEEHDDLHI